MPDESREPSPDEGAAVPAADPPDADLDLARAVADAAVEPPLAGAVRAPTVPNRQPVILGRRRSVVAAALMFALGAGLAYLILLALEQLQAVLVMLALALLIALTLDPLVTSLQRRGMPRWVAAILSWLLAVAVLIAPLVLAVHAASDQLPKLVDSLPHLLDKAESNLGSLGSRLRNLTSGKSGSTASISPDKVLTYLFEGGQVLFQTVASIVIVAVLSLLVLITLPRLVGGGLALVPRSRRDRVATVTDDLLRQVSRFMLANVLTSVLAGLATWAWAWSWGIPYPVLLGALVAVLDLIPTVGSTIGGVLVSLVALTVGLGTAIATAVFYIAFRLAEDYVIQPRAMRYSVELPGVITVPAVLLGGATLGIPGALFAVPIALVVRTLIRDVALPALDRR